MKPKKEAMITTKEALTLDAQYHPFPSFSEWSVCSVDESTWQKFSERLLEKKKTVSQDMFAKAIDFTIRAAAIDTGAIEGLYEVDRGFTFSVAIQAATWEAEAEARDVNIKRFFEAQTQAYELVLDAVTIETPLSEAWIRRLHELLCQPQEMYKVSTILGFQDQPLPKGVYKHYPNHVRARDGSTFSYAPVNDTPSEMHRLLEELRTQVFLNAHPILQASYAHYAFVKIHPFADGNGRVARAFASLYLYKAVSVPLVIYADQRDIYVKALRGADKGHFQDFVNFIFDRGIETLQIQLQRLEGTLTPSISESVSTLNKLFTGYPEFTVQNVDNFAYRLVEHIHREINKQSQQLTLPPEIKIRASMRTNTNRLFKSEAYRFPHSSNSAGEGRQYREIDVSLSSVEPAKASVEARFQVYVAKNPPQEGELYLKSLDLSQSFYAQFSDMIPRTTKALEIRIAIWVEQMLSEALAKLTKLASESLQKSDNE